MFFLWFLALKGLAFESKLVCSRFDCDWCHVVDTGVSVDCTWQKRGFTSLNGAVAAISIETGCVLDVEVMTRYCQGCINIAKFRDNREMREHFKTDHECTLNHEGSAGKNGGNRN